MEILNINEVNLDIINFFLNNPTIAKSQYDHLISFASSRGLNKSSLPFYTEEHHIVPKCMLGTNEENNLVLLTYREHILAHLLLYAIYPDIKGLSLNWKGENHPMYGKKHTDEARKKISDKLKGELHPLYGKHLKETTKAKLSEKHKEAVISPEGIEYPSIRDAAKALNLHRCTLSKWINKMPEKGWKKK